MVLPCPFFTHELLNMDKIGLLQYDIEEVLGESTLLVKMKESRQRKIMRQFSCGDNEDISRTVEKLKSFSKTIEHSYVIDIENAFSVANTVYLRCQFCEGGSLHALIKRARQYDDVINETELMEWLVQIALALQHLHARGITYGQLNPKEFKFSGSQSLCSVTPYTSPESLPDPSSPSKSSDACLMNRDPKKRLSVDDLLEKPFVSYHRKEMEDLQRAEATGTVNWPDATPATSEDVAGTKHQFVNEKDDKNFQEFRDGDDDSRDDDENNFLTAEDIDYLLNPPDS